MERKGTIKSLIGEIREKIPSKPQTGRKKETVYKKSHGRHKVHKLYVGWQHCQRGGVYRMVRLQQGGGITTIEYNVDEPKSVDQFIEFGKSLFFPKGKSTMGMLYEMDVRLGNFSGEVVDQFRDQDDKPCSFQDYLRCRGLYSSRHNVYLLTKFREEPQSPSEKMMLEELSGHQVECVGEVFEPPVSSTRLEDITSTLHEIELNQKWKIASKHPSCKLHIKYLLETQSSYSEEVTTRLTCNTLTDCKEAAHSVESHEVDYDPLSDGFRVISIEKDGNKFLDVNFEDDGPVYTFPNAIEQGNKIILHGPDELYGYESEQLLLGVVASCHGQSCEYVWYKDGVEFVRGPNLPLLVVDGAGTYSVGIQLDGVLYLHQRVVQVECAGNSLVHVPLKSSTRKDDLQSNLFPPDKSAMKISDSPPRKKRSVDSGTSTSNSLRGHLSLEKQSDDQGVHVSIPQIKKSDLMLDNSKDLGQGTFGHVYLADWMGTPVAVKEIKFKRMKIMKNVLHGEVQLHGRVRHPNIVQLMAYAIESSSICIVSEYVDGPNLDDILFGVCEEQSGRDLVLTLTQKLLISTQILHGISYVHNLLPPIIHQDIKPENVVIHRTSLVAKLCDFGVSRVKAMESISCTTSGGVNSQPGTPLYQAPEIHLKGKKSSTASDVWSASCTLVELFTEKSVWCVEEIQMSGESSHMDHVLECMKKEEKPPAFHNMKEEIPLTLRNILSQGLDYSPQARPFAFGILKILKPLTEST